MRGKMTFFCRAFLAGIMIGIGDVINAMSENRVLGALFFSLGLLSILHNGFYLYTGNVLLTLCPFCDGVTIFSKSSAI